MMPHPRIAWLVRTGIAGPTLGAGLLAASILLHSVPARADADADAKISRLLDLLVQKKIVSPKQARELFRETEVATPSRRAHVAPVGEEAAPPAKSGEIRVTYVPQFVRRQIADEVRAQVMTEAQTEGWAAPNALPEWTQRFRLYGDLRVRYERDSFDPGNSFPFTNFQAINQGSPFDPQAVGAGGPNPAFLNTTENRQRERVRARLGVQAQIDDWLTGDFRISTGADQGPVSPNQTEGAPGDFAKYNAYIDRAYFTATALNGLTVLAGRFPNPFATTDLLFYSELNFDGVSASYTHKITTATNAYIIAGAFPILNTAFDFSTNSSTKFAGRNSYLFALQAGGQWQVKRDLLAKIGVGFFDFDGVQGVVSSPCGPPQGSTYTCNTDSTRFQYDQFGNTVFGIRDIVNFPGSTPNNPQYFGLSSKFKVLEAHPRVEITSYSPFDIAIEGEILKNLAYNRADILIRGPVNFQGPQNNFGSIPKGSNATNGLYQGGDTGYMFRGQIGALKIQKLWDWNVSAAYKHLETDATLDSITDSDFHLGGTNAKGYILTGSLGIARNTFLSLRYFDASVISGPQDTNQVFQLDLQSSF